MIAPRKPPAVSVSAVSAARSQRREELEALVADLVTASAQEATVGPAAPTAGDSWRLALRATQLGDAVRAGISLPRTLFAPFSSGDALATLLAEAASEVPTWELAFLGPPLVEGLGEHLLLRRDELASLVVFARRVALAVATFEPPPELGQLLRALRENDARMRPLVAPITVAEALLGRGLDDGWYRDFEGPTEARDSAEAGADDETSAEALVLAALPASEAGTPATLVAYVASGAARRAVEAWAASAADHADDLVAVIDVALAAYEPVCFVARLWRRAQGHASGLLQFRPVALAAADETPDDVEQHTLGSFGIIAAEGTLEVSGRVLVLRVFEEEAGSVEWVCLGDSEAVAPAPGEPWVVEHPRHAGLDAVRLRVGGRGQEVSEMLPLGGP
jgi:hypothetical protein